MEAEGTGVQNHLLLHRVFETSLGYMRLYLKEKQDYKVEQTGDGEPAAQKQEEKLGVAKESPASQAAGPWLTRNPNT